MLAATGWRRGALVWLGVIGATFAVVLLLKLGSWPAGRCSVPGRFAPPAGTPPRPPWSAGGFATILARQLPDRAGRLAARRRGSSGRLASNSAFTRCPRCCSAPSSAWPERRVCPVSRAGRRSAGPSRCWPSPSWSPFWCTAPVCPPKRRSGGSLMGCSISSRPAAMALPPRRNRRAARNQGPPNKSRFVHPSSPSGDNHRVNPADDAAWHAAFDSWLLGVARPSASAVGILEPHDIVLAEIGAGLHLDQRQRDQAGILQPVHAAQRQIDALVLAQDQGFLRRGSPGRCR